MIDLENYKTTNIKYTIVEENEEFGCFKLSISEHFKKDEFTEKLILNLKIPREDYSLNSPVFAHMTRLVLERAVEIITKEIKLVW